MWIKRNRVKNIVCPLLRWPQDCCIVGIIGWKGNKSCKNKRAMFHVLWGQCLWSPFIDISLVSITFTEYWKYSKSFSIIGDFFSVMSCPRMRNQDNDVGNFLGRGFESKGISATLFLQNKSRRINVGKN